MKGLMSILMMSLVVFLSSFKIGESPPLEHEHECTHTIDSLNDVINSIEVENNQLVSNLRVLKRNHLLLIEKLEKEGKIICQDFGFYYEALNVKTRNKLYPKPVQSESNGGEGELTSPIKTKINYRK